MSLPSLISGVVLYSLTAGVISLARRSTSFLKRSGVSALLLVCVFATVRLVLPIEMPFTFAVRSWSLLGAAQQFLRSNGVVVQLALRVWGIGAVVAVAIDVLLLCWAHRRSRGYIIVENPLVEEVVRRSNVGCPVLVSPDVESPYVSGIVHHTIYLPAQELSEREIEMILAHETQHIRTHDAQIKLFFGLISALLWWNPFAHLWKKDISTLLEFRCDAKVTERMNEVDRQAYLEMLLRLAKQIVTSRYPLVLDESRALGRKTVLEQRFRVAMARAGKKTRPIHKVMQWVLLLTMFFLSYIVMLQPASAPPAESFQNDSRTTYEESYEDLEIGEGKYGTFIFEASDGRYKLYKNYVFIKYLSEEEMASEKYRYLYIFEEAEPE